MYEVFVVIFHSYFYLHYQTSIFSSRYGTVGLVRSVMGWAVQV